MQSLTLESVTEKDAGALARLMPRLHAKAFTGGLIVLTFILVGIFGPYLAPHDPNKQELTAMMKAPQGLGAVHVLGTDNLGRDIFSRVIHGSRVSLLVAFAVVFVSGLIAEYVSIPAAWFVSGCCFILVSLYYVRKNKR